MQHLAGLTHLPRCPPGFKPKSIHILSKSSSLTPYSDILPSDVVLIVLISYFSATSAILRKILESTIPPGKYGIIA